MGRRGKHIIFILLKEKKLEERKKLVIKRTEQLKKAKTNKKLVTER